MPEKPKVVFPYRSLSEGLRDRWQKIGGPEQAFRFLKQGFKFLAWRKNWAVAARERQRREDEAFRKENGR